MPDYRQMAIAAAQAAGIDPNIFVRQMLQESGLQPGKTSPAGARGIAQFMPATARGLGINPDNPRQALNAAARMDAANLRKYGNWRDTLSLYNSGQGWQRGRNIGETNHYVRSILSGQGGGAMSAPVSSPGSPQAANGGSSDAFHAAVASFLLDQSNSLASGGKSDPNAILQLALARQTLNQPSDQAQQLAGQVQGSKAPANYAGPPGKVGWEGTPLGGERQDFLRKVSAAVNAVGGTKVRVISGYRSPEHNRAVGGAKDSNHTYGRAMDGQAFIPGKGWVDLGIAIRPVASRFGLRSGASFNWGGRPDTPHVDDGFNQHH